MGNAAANVVRHRGSRDNTGKIWHHHNNNGKHNKSHNNGGYGLNGVSYTGYGQGGLHGIGYSGIYGTRGGYELGNNNNNNNNNNNDGNSRFNCLVCPVDSSNWI